MPIRLVSAYLVPAQRIVQRHQREKGWLLNDDNDDVRRYRYIKLGRVMVLGWRRRVQGRTALTRLDGRKMLNNRRIKTSIGNYS